MSFIVIKTSEDLRYLDRELLTKKNIGLDTEFRRTSKENILLSLIQINDSHETYLIDCLSIGEYQNNATFLFSKNVNKIFHSFREDFEAIFSWTKKWPENIFDTQLANAFLGGKFSVGYKELVFDRLEVTIDKHETRSNWIKRPLTDSQLSYAASDVEFLIKLFEYQSNELDHTKKKEWFFEQQAIYQQKFFSGLTEKNEITLHKIDKEKEKNFLKQLNRSVNLVAKEFNVNPTLLLSKGDQKYFLLTVLSCDIDTAFDSLPSWKRKILSSGLKSLFLKIDIESK